jgi:DNA-binding CsgD family transcriptional regulator
VTAQERRVLECLADGMTVAQTAARLSISPVTVRFHIRQLKKRLGAGSAQALIARAFALGLVRPR